MAGSAVISSLDVRFRTATAYYPEDEPRGGATPQET